MLAYVALLVISAFDKPVKIDTVSSDGNRALTCWLYPGFMVKQLDAHEKGAERLSFVRYSGGAPSCDRTIAVGVEKVLDDWSGYYAGALGELVVFNGDDGWHGGMGFAVYDTTTGDQVFKDARVGDMSVKDNTLLYKRVTTLDCNAGANKPCAQKGMKLAATKKDLGGICKKGYASWIAKFQAQIAKQECDAVCKRERKIQLDSFKTSSSMVSYEVVVDRAKWQITPKANNLECWPQD